MWEEEFDLESFMMEQNDVYTFSTSEMDEIVNFHMNRPSSAIKPKDAFFALKHLYVLFDEKVCPICETPIATKKVKEATEYVCHACGLQNDFYKDGRYLLKIEDFEWRFHLQKGQVNPQTKIIFNEILETQMMVFDFYRSVMNGEKLSNPMSPGDLKVKIRQLHIELERLSFKNKGV